MPSQDILELYYKFLEHIHECFVDNLDSCHGVQIKWRRKEDKMESLKLYDLDDAMKDIAKGVSGLEASKRKWQSIANALDAIDDSMSEYCGLCLESGHDCGSCPIPAATLRSSEVTYCVCCDLYTECCEELKELEGKVNEMLRVLNSINWTRVNFDTDGLTNECPASPFPVQSDECFKCMWHRGHLGFSVRCGYQEDLQPEPGTIVIADEFSNYPSSEEE